MIFLERYTVQRVGPKRRKVPKEQSIRQSNQRYADICVMVKDPRTGKGTMLRALLDSGYTKSIILKYFTSPKERKLLSKKDCCRYETYGGHFTSNSTANVVFRLVEFNKNKDF